MFAAFLLLGPLLNSFTIEKWPGVTFKPAINSIKRKESRARAAGSRVASFSRRLLEKRLATGLKVAYNKNAATGMVRQPVERSRLI